MEKIQFSEALISAQAVAGISRVADLTHLDIIGMPVAQAIRPASKNYVVSQGKGKTLEQAKISAIMESLEFFHGENISTDLYVEPIKIRSTLGYSIEELPIIGDIDHAKEIFWTSAVNLVNDKPSLLPVDLISLDFTKTCNKVRAFRNTSNGYAGGSTQIGAIRHGLLEVIERHIVSTGSQIRIDMDAHVIESISDYLPTVRKHGLKLALFAFRSEFRIPTFKAIVHDPVTSIAFSGTACSPSRNDAIEKAFQEAFQSRLTHITASRDDLTGLSYQLLDKLPERGHVTSKVRNSIKLSDIWNSNIYLEDDSKIVEFSARELIRSNYKSIIIKTLKHPEIEIPFVVVCVPGLKFTWSHFT